MEYINKQSLLADLNETTPRSYFAFETMVREYPTEDVAPVVHAHWINCRGNYVSMDAHGCVDGECLCSACGDYLTASDEYGVRGFYCPNCGARMDEEVE